MPAPCTSAEITAPRCLAAMIPFSEPVVLSSPTFRRVCRSVSLSTDGVLVLSQHPLPRGRALAVKIPVCGGRTLELTAVVAQESTYMGRRALDVRFINLARRERLLIEGIVAQAASPSRATPPAKKLASRSPHRSTVIEPKDEFDGLPSTDEIDSMLAKTLAELKETPKKKRKGRFSW